MIVCGSGGDSNIVRDDALQPCGCGHSPRSWRNAMKIKLALDSLSVDSFDTGHATQARGTVHAHAAPSDHCNTRQPFCQLPSVYRPCITDEVECG